MKYLAHLMILLFVVCLVGADEEKEAADKKKPQTPEEQEKLQGRWRITSIEEDGKSKENLAEIQLEVAADKLTLRSEKDGIDLFREAVFTLDPSKQPAQISWKLTIDGREHLWQGIYALDGDKLRLCWCGPGLDRPKQFTTSSGDGCFLYVMAKTK